MLMSAQWKAQKDTTVMPMPLVSILLGVSIVHVTLATPEVEQFVIVNFFKNIYCCTQLSIQKCADVDECAEGTDNCHRESNATCEDTDGSFMCMCRDGFSGNGTSCEGKSMNNLTPTLIFVFIKFRC